MMPGVGMETNESAPTILLATCIERKNNGALSDRDYLEKRHGIDRNAKILYVRTDGGSLHHFQNSTLHLLKKYPTIRGIVILPHLDCGAAKFFESKGGKELEEFKKGLRPDLLYNTLEKAGIGIIGVTDGGYIDTPHLPLPTYEGEHVLAIVRESTLSPEVLAKKAQTRLFDTYFAQGPLIKDLYPAISIAVDVKGLGIKSIRFVPRNESERRAMEKERIELGKQPFMSGVNIWLMSPTPAPRQKVSSR